MPSTIPLFAAPAPAPAGLEEEEEDENPLIISFLTVPTPSSATDLHLPPHVYYSNGTVTKEMQKQKKRETDRRYRKNKKKAVQETENKLAMTIIENENLKSTVEKFRQEIFHLTSQLKLIYQRFETIYTELEKEIECARTENELTGCLLNDPNTINI
ncbi:hypothetical protein POPTR_001G004900v4 [Populus trichocarpa]|uniref:BZIP domain-containing protein n=1 Tax=Populus trichocarpa TaxID=3694 RepID=B9GLE6_POPTR|nr:uncharacterized protein LOC7457698 [Populus trichocarpa]PNT51961.1 hypothetical protein POPTR_001G004900v4 [Populus trichocarpa]|eukprot:XP_002299106.1 uncharacterized protein LOC7457698 [Populus trichocarpa]